MTAQVHYRTLRRVALLATLLAATALIAHARSRSETIALQAPTAPITRPAADRPRIDVVFALDTTGSMSGLIEGAKQKIWSVASAMADGQPTPEIRIGLVAYRDRGDDYVTRRFDLTDDIDAVYAKLQGFAAGGGGDTPESVNQALREAVTDMSWSTGNDVYRVVFLVGDAPPHMDYPNDVGYAKTVELAKRRGIAINTIQCGTLGATTQVWQEIARRGGGQYAAIRQDGGMVALRTPMDDDLARLNEELAATVLPYGDDEAKAEIGRALAASKAAEPAVTASRLGYLAKQGGRLTSGVRDLVDAVKEGLVSADSVPDEALPEELRGLDAGARSAFVAKKIADRAEIQDRIDALTAERDAHLRAEAERLAAKGAADGFDQKVLETIREQATAAGIRYE
jgi:Mg-chelatase subunit ChlD